MVVYGQVLWYAGCNLLLGCQRKQPVGDHKEVMSAVLTLTVFNTVFLDAETAYHPHHIDVQPYAKGLSQTFPTGLYIISTLFHSLRKKH